MEHTGINRFRNIFPAILTVLVMTGMVALADGLGEREILFPEIAALAFGYLLAPKRAWMVTRARMLFLMSLCAVAGLLISRFLPFPLWIKIAAAFALSQVIFLWSGTTFAPLVSAIVLPVILGTTSVVYPISACLLTLAVILLRLLLEKLGIRAREPFAPVPAPDAGTLVSALIRCTLITVLAFLCVRRGMVYIIAPPILVFFTEVSGKHARARKTPFTSVLFITMCALAGATARTILSVRRSFPLALAALLASCLLLVIVYIFNMYFPPAGAACMLAMLVPESSLLVYPLEILAGGSLFMAVSLLIASFGKKAGFT